MSLNPEIGFYQTSAEADQEMDDDAEIDVEDFVDREESPDANNKINKEERKG
jgi:hypothetical protein